MSQIYSSLRPNYRTRHDSLRLDVLWWFNTSICGNRCTLHLLPPPPIPGASKRSRPIHMRPHQPSTPQLTQRRKMWILLSMMYLWGKPETHWVLTYWQLYHHLNITLPPNSHLRYNKTCTKKPGPLLWGVNSHWRSADRHKNQMVPSGIHLGHIGDIATIQKLIRTYIILSIRHWSHSKPPDI